MILNWPTEIVNRERPETAVWFQPGSNNCLDFHGDPLTAELAVFSDGNHHMALEETLEAFRARHDLHSIFYCTTPPAVYLRLARQGFIDLGNLRISRQADVVIGPDTILQDLLESGQLESTRGFARSLGNSLLVARQNPKNIDRLEDLFRDDVRLFVSNPETETASFEVYRETISRLAAARGVPADAVAYRFAADNSTLIVGENIHHREAPAAIADGRADAAIVYHHLALRYTRIFPDVFALVELPFGTDNLTTEYHAGIRASGNSLADSLVDHLTSQQTKSIYEHHGLAAY